MDDEAKQKKALEDINLIKEIIQKTSISMQAFNHIFIAWGILFTVISIVLIIGSFIPLPTVRTDITPSGSIFINNNNIVQIIMISFSFLIWPLSFFITRSIYKKITIIYPINGVSKQLMSIWVYILIFLILCFIISTSIANINLRNSFIIIELILLAFGLFCTYIFTKLKFPFILSIIYSLIGLYIMMSPNYGFFLSVILIPFTFLVIGIYLRRKERAVA